MPCPVVGVTHSADPTIPPHFLQLSSLCWWCVVAPCECPVGEPHADTAVDKVVLPQLRPPALQPERALSLHTFLVLKRALQSALLRESAPLSANYLEPDSACQ